MLLPEDFFRHRKLESLVENQTSYELEHAAMHIFETHEQAERVILQFDQPVLASMISGKKIMHLKDKNAFNFYPGESLVLPAQETMCIDFPEANHANPTRCLAMAINEEQIQHIVQMMNETMPRTDHSEWCLMDYNFHFTNDQGIYQLLQRLLFLFTENHPSKNYFVNNMLVELIVRILQTDVKKYHLEAKSDQVNNNRMSAVVNYILTHLHENLTIEQLSARVYMSESHFYRVFRNEMGISPLNFVNTERIKKAMELLRNPDLTVKEVYMECGFDNRSYFNRLFKKHSNLSPLEFQYRMNQDNQPQ